MNDSPSAPQEPSSLRSLECVRDRFLDAVGRLSDEEVRLPQGLGRFLASAPVAGVSNPMQDSVALDGVAVRAADATKPGTRLRVVGRGFPGRPFVGSLASGQAVVVATGAPLPEGADAVAPVEEVESSPTEPAMVRLLRPVRPWQFVRFRGEDFAEGQVLLGEGHRIGPGCVALLATAGIQSVRVFRRPRVGILPTGSELVPIGNPPGPGQVVDGNSPMLEGLLTTLGAEVRLLPGVPDNPDRLDAALREALPSVDLLITTGGASVGEPDLVRPALRRIGASVHEGPIAMKPGKPFFWAQSEGHLVAGLPGNPASAWVTALLLVVPVLRRFSGVDEVSLPTVQGVLAEPLHTPGNRRQFFRVIMDRDGKVRLAGTQASHHVQSLAESNGLVDQPAGLHWPEGTPVQVIRWNLLE
ncbi:MAG: gephyrin-like molybdotransferase Glp [Verrucomicrobiota bacterium]